MSPQLLARIFKRQLWQKLLNTFLDFQSFNIPNSAPLIRAQMCSRGYPASFFKALNECWESMKGEIMSQRHQIPWAVNWLTSFCKKKWKDNLRWIVPVFLSSKTTPQLPTQKWIMVIKLGLLPYDFCFKQGQGLKASAAHPIWGLINGGS